MGKLEINSSLLNRESGEALVSVCPFGAISFDGEKIDISSACKMCKLCVKKSAGLVEYKEDVAAEIDKDAWRGILVFADASAGTLHKVSFELLGKAQELARVTHHPVWAILIGHEVKHLAQELCLYGAEKVFVYDDEAFRHFRSEPYTAAFHDAIEKHRPSSVLVGATALGRALAPRVAARCRTGLTADCTVLDMKENTDLVQIRPAFGGNIMAQIVTPNTRPQFCTARYKVFDPAPVDAPSGEIVEMQVTDAMRESGIEIISSEKKPPETDISESDVIVAVGRGASSDSMRAAAEELAALLGGTVASSRPLVEANLYDAKRQIGLSGRTVKPKLIITLGISGAVQFAAGMKSSDCIVAINTDPSAPIFDVAHYGVVGDVSVIVPRLIKLLKGEE